MNEHTPGPWPKPEHDNSDVSANEWWNVPGIARYIYDEANARLIAAAPEMLAELERCREDFLLHAVGLFGCDMLKAAESAKESADRVAALIAKAKGE